MPMVEEIAYREGVRALEGQARDLENIRTHLSIVLTAGGVAVALFASNRSATVMRLPRPGSRSASSSR